MQSIDPVGIAIVNHVHLLASGYCLYEYLTTYAICNVYFMAVGSLVVRASDSRPEGLGSMPDATKYPPSIHGVRAH
ncbi:hypothetical protein TNCV_1471451 [Trichonephila clavipes]|nr:hypothetical protein TNCV_1471451 [Trichonephila clavipes]